MRKLLLMVLCCLFAVGIAQADVGDDLIINGSFDSGLGTWVLTGEFYDILMGGQWEGDGSVAMTGWTSAIPKDGTCLQTISGDDVVAGMEYLYTVNYARLDNLEPTTPNTFLGVIQCYDALDALIATDVLDCSSAGTYPASSFSKQGTLPEGTSYIKVGAEIDGVLNWSAWDQFSLIVEFVPIPGNPYPADESNQNPLDVTQLCWDTPNTENAVSANYSVYWSLDNPNVGADYPATLVASGSCDPDATKCIPLPEATSMNHTYYWVVDGNVVDSVEGSVPFAGPTWWFTTANAPPVVDAGNPISQNVWLSSGSAVVSLDGSATDDGLPDPPGALTTLWISDPAVGASFTNASDPVTDVTFTAAGDYTLTLSADDGSGAVTDSVYVRVVHAEGSGFDGRFCGYEFGDADVTITTPDPTGSVEIISTGTGGLSLLNERDKLLKLAWTNETDGSVSARHTWTSQTFDLNGNDRILVDLYIPSSSGVGSIGVSGDDYLWHPDVDTLVKDMWYTAEFDVTSNTETGQNDMTIVFQGLTETSGVVYMDNIRVVNFTPVIKEICGEEKRIDIVCEHVIAKDLDGYNIYRAPEGSSSFVKINSTIDPFNAYSDYTNDYGVTYKYKVTSVVNSVESAFSEEASATTAASAYDETDFLVSIQRAAFRFMWEFGHPVSGLGRKTEPAFPNQCFAGWGLRSILVGAKRGWITRDEAALRVLRMATFLQDKAVRHGGAWPTIVDGRSGETVPWNAEVGDRADIVDSALMISELLSARQYFDGSNSVETDIRNRANTLWEEVQWPSWLIGETMHWLWSEELGVYESSPGYPLEVTALGETQIVYLMAIASPTHPIPVSCYENGWYKHDWYFNNGNKYYGIKQWIGIPYGGGPLFITHYSYLGFDPRNIADGYCNYYKNNRNISLIHQAYCEDNMWGYTGYGNECWGITASYAPAPLYYYPHAPDVTGPDLQDKGTIAPTAAVCAIVYTPQASLLAMHHFYDTLYEDLWGPFGFYDAFNETLGWTSDSYITIDQNPMVPMIENYLTGFCWDLFMSCPEIPPMLDAIGFLKDPEDNMLYNGNFDEGDVGSLRTITVPGWTISGWNGEVHNTIGKKIGGQALTLGDNTSVSREMAVTEGKDYDFSGYLASFTSSGDQLYSGQAVIRAQWLDAGSSVIRTDTVSIFQAGVDPYDEWKYANVTLQAPANSVNVKIIAQLENAVGFAYFDGICMLPVEIEGDFEPDGDIDLADIQYFVQRWLMTGCQAPGWCEGADLDHIGGKVDLLDFAMLAENWLEGVE